LDDTDISSGQHPDAVTVECEGCRDLANVPVGIGSEVVRRHLRIQDPRPKPESTAEWRGRNHANRRVEAPHEDGEIAMVLAPQAKLR
jgi:hypothetical protein